MQSSLPPRLDRRGPFLVEPPILFPRRLAEFENPAGPSPKKTSAVETAIRHDAYILGEIDMKWPTEAPARFAL